MENRLNIDTAIRFVFRDQNWVGKVLVGGFLCLTMIGSIPVLGWALEIQRRAMRGENEPLPEWDDWGKYLVDGFKLWLVQVIWGLPITVCVLLVIIPAFMMTFVYEMNQGSEMLLLASSAIFVVIMPLLAAFSLFLILLWPVYTGILIETDDILQALNPARVFRLLRANFWQMALAAFLGYTAIYGATMIGVYLCFVGMFFLAPIGYAMMHHLFGQAYRIARARAEAAELVAS